MRASAVLLALLAGCADHAAPKVRHADQRTPADGTDAPHDCLAECGAGEPQTTYTYNAVGILPGTGTYAHMTESIASMVEPLWWLANTTFKPAWKPGLRPLMLPSA